MIFKKWFSTKNVKKDEVLDLVTGEFAKEAKELNLFDEKWYVSNNRDVDFSSEAPLKHFVEKGFLENRDPSPNFSLSRYIESYPDVAQANINPLLHYIRSGKKEGRSIEASFQGMTLQQHLEKVELAEEHSLIVNQLDRESDFQSKWYVKTYGELDIDEGVALKHYVLFGAQQGLDPSPFFSTKKYKERYKEHVSEKVNPFLHYSSVGKRDGLVADLSNKSHQIDINVLLEDFALSNHQQRDALVIEAGSWFDKKWYIESLNEEVEHALAIKHYIVVGANQSKDPCPLFSTDFYLTENDDVSKSGMNPLSHYQQYGLKEGRVIKSSKIAGDITVEKEVSEYQFSESQTIQITIITESKWFNRNWYVDSYPELNISSNMAVKHYYLFGVSEEKDPCPFFSTLFYLANNPDIVNSGMNPLFHYIKFGRSEGRAILSSKYARLDIAGNVESGTNLCLQRFYSASENEQLKSTELNESMISTINESTKVIEEKFLSTDINEVHNKLFDTFCETYSAETSIVNAWQNSTVFNIEHYFYDIAISKQNTLKVRFRLPQLEQKIAIIEAVQYDSDDMSRRCVSTSNVTITSLNITALEIPNVFYPILLIFKFEDKTVLTQLIPFPSLLRGGQHFGELCVNSQSGAYLKDYVKYTTQLFTNTFDFDNTALTKRIHVSLKTATGNEPLFNHSFMTWIWYFFKVQYIGYIVSPKNSLEQKRCQYFSELLEVIHDVDNSILVNPIDKDALPSLMLVVNVAGSNKRQGSKIIVPEKLTDGKSKVVTLETISTSEELQSYSDDLSTCFPFPSSVIQRLRKSHEANELISRPLYDLESKISKNPLSVSLILYVTENNHANQARLWDSIRNQKGIGNVDIVLAYDCIEDFSICLPQKSSYLQIIVRKSDEDYSGFYNRCLLATKQDIVIHTSESAIFYDNTSIHQLALLLSPSIKSASCKLLYKKRKGKGYELQKVKNSFIKVHDGASVSLESPLNNDYYPANEVFYVFANLPFIVANEKKVMLEFLETHHSDDLTTVFLDFGAYLATQELSVVASHKFAIGIEFDEKMSEPLVELSDATISTLETCISQVEERRGC